MSKKNDTQFASIDDAALDEVSGGLLDGAILSGNDVSVGGILNGSLNGTVKAGNGVLGSVGGILNGLTSSLGAGVR